jgi:hypothetical protein
MPDFVPDADDFKDIIKRFGAAWLAEDSRAVRRAFDATGNGADRAALDSLYRSLNWLRGPPGLAAGDIQVGNVGLLPDGSLAMRDFGFFRGPAWADDAVARLRQAPISMPRRYP